MPTSLPMIAAATGLTDCLRAYLCHDTGECQRSLKEGLGRITGQRSIFLTNTGIAAFYLILKALQKASSKNEVILPAYTAGSLVVAIKKAGLTPVLCDNSLDDFNMSSQDILNKISPRTLAVNYVHLHGIAGQAVASLRAQIPRDIYLIEDCAQAMGSCLNGKPVGSYSDVSFFSFNRGKNIPLYAGGFIATNLPDIAALINGQYASCAHTPGSYETFAMFLRVLAFSLATKPFLYGLVRPLAFRCKDVSVPDDFEAKAMSSFQINLGGIVLPNHGTLFSRRRDNGAYLYGALQNIPALKLPAPVCLPETVFNRFPLLIDDAKKIPALQQALRRHTIESSRGYEATLCDMFDLGLPSQAFPGALALAQNLLTLPVHPRVTHAHLTRICRAIKESLS